MKKYRSETLIEVFIYAEDEDDANEQLKSYRNWDDWNILEGKIEEVFEPYTEFGVMGIRQDNCVQIVDWCENEAEAIQSAKSIRAGENRIDGWKYVAVGSTRYGYWESLEEGVSLHNG